MENQPILYGNATIKELQNIDKQLLKTKEAFKDLVKQASELNMLFSRGTPREYVEGMTKLNDLMVRLAKTERDLLDLEARYQNVSNQTAQATRNRTQATTELERELQRTIRLEGEESAALARQKTINRELTRELRLRSQQETLSNQRLNTSMSLYRNIEIRMQALTGRYQDLALKKQLGNQLSAKEERQLTNLQTRIKKYDDALKAVDASIGKHQRNVGNYAGSFDSLGASINQITREAPAFAVSAQTGFLAISNNLPIFFDALSQTRKRLKESAAQMLATSNAARTNAESTALAAGATNAEAKAIGKRAAIQALATPAQLEAATAAGINAERTALAAGATAAQAKAAKELAIAQLLANTVTSKAPSLLATLAKSLFSVQTLLSVAVTLLTIYGKDVVNWAKGLFTANTVMGYYKKNLKDINEAKKEGIKSAATEITQLKTLYRVAQDTALSTEQRMRAVRKLQDLYPAYFENLSAETIMTGKATAEYKELAAAIVASAQARAIEKILSERMEKSMIEEERLINNLNKSIAEGAKIKKSGLTESRLVSDGQGGLVKKEIKNQDLLSGAVYKVGVNMRALDKFRKKTAAENETLIQKQIQLQNQAAKYEADKYGKDAPKQKGQDLTKEQRDYLNTLQAIRDTEIAIAKESHLNKEIDEKQYWERYITAVKTYREKIANYLNGANGKQRQIEASVRRRAVEEIVKANKEIFDYEKGNLEAQFKMKQEVTERKLNEINNDEYSFEIEKINKRNDLLNEQINDTTKFYDDLLSSAQKYSQEYIAIEADKADKIGALQDKINNNSSNAPKALQDYVDYYRKIEDSTKRTKNINDQTKIIQNSKLNDLQKEFALETLLNNQRKTELEIDRERIESDIKILSGKKRTIEEEEKLKKLEEDLAKNRQESAKNHIESLDILVKKYSKIKEILSQGFYDLGFTNLAQNIDNSFSDLFKKLKDKTLEWKDFTVLAASAIADALIMISNTQKEKTIANLDEQLKASQQSSEQEIGFINQRLQYLNNLEDATVEQIQERNRLEDEARGMKEQQLMREKMISTQKAKAEQRAAAQQAVINGLLAATMTLANLGIPAGIIPAAIAAGMGVAMSALIMSKNPAPQYFVGTDSAREGWAYTQERGAEIIADKSGNIKSWGNNRGSQLTYMEEGDKVLTAFESQDFKKKIKDVSIPDNLFLNYARESVLPSIIIPKQEDHSQKIIDGVGKELERVFGKFDKTNVYENENGDIVIERGSRIPEVRKKKKQKPTTIIIQKPNVRD